MASHNSNRNEGHRRGRSASFYGQDAAFVSQLRRHMTVSDLSALRNHAGALPEGLPRQPPKMLLKVTVLRCLAPVQVLLRTESSVGHLIAAALRQYVKEGRRPILPSDEPSDFELHYSQFSLENLDKKEKVKELGSRNFFLCPRKVEGGVTTPLVSCSKEVDRVAVSQECGGGGGGFAWFKLMQFMM
ncbi:hypothetical protein Fmac_019542 [Flemingia macrophylla]|uniref:DUF7054 domain-containing protein n=1 Tax=Flemingia macrophylla TaxID=520843 RepID=A0ABD1M832_9FABA